jgi:hypothetical protein
MMQDTRVLTKNTPKNNYKNKVSTTQMRLNKATIRGFTLNLLP